MEIENEDTDLDMDEQLEQIEADAKKLGWVPEDEFKGRKDHWVDAQTFLERGEQVMPILRQNNRKLKIDLDKSNAKVEALSSQISEMNSALDRMEKYVTQASKQQVSDAKASLKAAIKEAREENDFDKEEELREKLADAIEREKQILAEEEANLKRDKKPASKAGEPQLDASVQEFIEENPWFTNPDNAEDRKRAKLFSRFCEDLREEEPDLPKGREFLDEALRRFEDMEEKPPVQRKTSKVDSGETVRRPANSSTSGKSFNSLPKEAQRACLDFADDLVGPGKRYKTLADWQKKYTKDYYENED